MKLSEKVLSCINSDYKDFLSTSGEKHTSSISLDSRMFDRKEKLLFRKMAKKYSPSRAEYKDTLLQIRKHFNR